LSGPICSNSSAWRASASAEAALTVPSKDRSRPREPLLLPAVDHRRVDAVMAGQFVDRAIAIVGRQGDLGLEQPRVDIPFARHRFPALGHQFRLTVGPV